MTRESIHTKKIYCICFLVLVSILGIASICVYINNHFIGKEDVAVIHADKKIQFAQLYPFDDETEGVALGNQSDSGLIQKYIDMLDQITKSTEAYLTSLSPFYSPIARLSKILPDQNNGDVVLNGSNPFVKLSNGYLAGCFDYCLSPESQEHILGFSAWLKGQGIPFVALIQADKSDDSITAFPEGVPHGYSRMFDEYKTFLEDNGINYIDAKPVLLADNDDLYSWFYKSDHHWNVQAAYRMAQETSRFLNDELLIPSDKSAISEEDYELRTYPDSFLGSYGKKLGDAWTEDMEIYYPINDTSFHIEIPGEGIDKTGNFNDTLIDQSLLEDDNVSYSAFLYGDRPLVHIENKNCKNGTRVLVIKYSFADALCPYLANTVQYLDVIDPRHFDGSIRTFITQTKPDAVILCMGVPTEDDEKNLRLK